VNVNGLSTTHQALPQALVISLIQGSDEVCFFHGTFSFLLENNDGYVINHDSHPTEILVGVEYALIRELPMKMKN
jgi:hypothetical protein